MSKFQALEVVDRGSETQLQVPENLNYFIFTATSRAKHTNKSICEDEVTYIYYATSSTCRIRTLILLVATKI